MLCLLSYTHHPSIAEAYGARKGGIEPPTFLKCPFGGPAGIETGSCNSYRSVIRS
jgi:hypothetical protein